MQTASLLLKNGRNAVGNARDCKKWRNRHSALLKKGIDKWANENREKKRAHSIMFNALKRGEIVRPRKCDECHEERAPFADGRSAIEAHHTKYVEGRESLKFIRWLCRGCHKAQHTIDKAAQSTISHYQAA